MIRQRQAHRPIDYHGVTIMKPITQVEIDIPSTTFSGRIVVYFENGKARCNYPLMDGTFIASLDTFLEIAQQAGATVQWNK